MRVHMCTGVCMYREEISGMETEPHLRSKNMKSMFHINMGKHESN